MRFVALIALIDFLLVTIIAVTTSTGLSTAGLMGAATIATVVCLFGVPLGLIFGFPLLWLSRRLAPGNPIPLAILATILGALIPVFVTWGLIWDQMVAIGASVGFVSAMLWWALVERHPARRIRYD